MHKFLLLLLILLSINVGAQKKRIIPPGTVRVNDTLFVDETEVANVYWREYLYYLLQFSKDKSLYEKMLPDTTLWRPDTSSMQITEYYFRHPGFNYFPLVGVSYEQAVAFCEWRTYMANQGVYFREKKIKDPKNHLTDSFPIRFYYRLPTKEEWEMIASSKDSTNKYPYGYKDVYTRWKGKMFKSFNCDYSALDGQPNDKGYSIDKLLVTIPPRNVKSFFKNDAGTYDMIGNVAEMVIEKGIAKGGSFFHAVDSCKIKNDQYYTQPERWLGFRCVAVIKNY